MLLSMVKRAIPVDTKAEERERQTSREQLLEAAGQVVAEKGFERATGKEITERARVNGAAVNYYFGSLDGLFAAVLEEAHNRFVTHEMLLRTIEGQPDARARLTALIRLVLRGVMGPTSTSWALRVLAHAIARPSPAFAALREREIVPKARILKGIVAELMGLPLEHPAVARGCVSIIAPVLLLVVGDRETRERLFPAFGYEAGDADAIADHMVRFALGGLAATGSKP